MCGTQATRLAELLFLERLNDVYHDVTPPDAAAMEGRAPTKPGLLPGAQPKVTPSGQPQHRSLASMDT
jgi:hypothetical protein